MTSVRRMNKILKEAEDRLEITRDKRADIDSFAKLMKARSEEKAEGGKVSRYKNAPGEQRSQREGGSHFQFLSSYWRGEGDE